MVTFSSHTRTAPDFAVAAELADAAGFTGASDLI
jgi:hypothetical protein